VGDAEVGALFRLDGRRALITGAGAGLGRELALLFAQAGAAVAVTGRTLEKLEVTCDAVKQHGSPAAVALAADVSVEGEVIACVDAARDALGGVIDVLVNAAAIYPRYRLPDLSAAAFDEIMGVNLRGAFLMMRAVVQQLREAKSAGAVVNISSVAAEVTVVHHNVGYAASKGGLNALTRSMAAELASENIRVNAVLPIGFESPGLTQALHSDVPLEGPGCDPQRLPIGRLARPREVALAALYLASPAASFVTGQLLAVDGGYLAA
jgi:NAD(P)-dependent dehydrogenase (short-subunit alcohol dehydrogenase family)